MSTLLCPFTWTDNEPGKEYVELFILVSYFDRISHLNFVVSRKRFALFFHEAFKYLPFGRCCKLQIAPYVRQMARRARAREREREREGR